MTADRRTKAELREEIEILRDSLTQRQNEVERYRASLMDIRTEVTGLHNMVQQEREDCQGQFREIDAAIVDVRKHVAIRRAALVEITDKVEEKREISLLCTELGYVETVMDLLFGPLEKVGPAEVALGRMEPQ